VKFRAFVLSALALAACGRAENTPAASAQDVAAPGAQAESCEASSDGVWRVGGADYSVRATASGPSCAQAVAVLVVRASDGSAILTHAAPSAYIFGLKDATDEAAMGAALNEWRTPADGLATTADLPAWAAGADQPGGEFVFYPEAGYDERAAYEALRAQGLALFCFAQGGESLACYALQDGRMDRVGVQTFPG
jgi:hypothetical protein